MRSHFRNRPLTGVFLFFASLIAQPSNSQDSAAFINAVKNLLFGSQNISQPTYSTFISPENYSSGYTAAAAPVSMYPHHTARTYHQYPAAVVQPPYPQPLAQPPPTVSVPLTSAVCQLPQQIGTGPYRIPRWYYNPQRMRCELFYWSGCCGNANNFQTFQTCQQLCEVDPCSLPMDQGVGSSKLTRYYFNSIAKLCEEFTFFGAGGNRNNFPALEECQDQCPESPNPCAVPTANPPQQCVPGNGCLGQSYCHVGAATTTTVCCPKPLPVDRCQQPLNVGIGNSNLQRYYYNPLTQTCSPCVYRGLQGNENNFVTQQECEIACLAVNPCRLGVPFRNAQLQTVQCSAINPAVCPAGYYCHIGADPTTTVCCQALEVGVERCNLPLEKGEGRAALTRFYYNREQRACFAFNYLGMKGNNNNFYTKEECEDACPVWVNPCAAGSPPLGRDRRSIGCNVITPCPAESFCHVGVDPSTTICCPSSVLPRCAQGLQPGHGPHRIPRWFFNRLSRQCQPFIYSGQNLIIEYTTLKFMERDKHEYKVWVNPCPIGNPLMRAEQPVTCQRSLPMSCPSGHFCHHGVDASTTVCCMGVADPCAVEVVEGEGSASIPRYFFDSQKRECLPFLFRGMKANANNFASEEECKVRCPVRVDPCPISFSSLSHAVSVRSCAANHICPESQWCHVGQTAETTVCCPNAVADPCMAPPRNPGIGEWSSTRWAFDPSMRRCVSFDYRGLRGNSNNFLTKEICEKKCPVFENPCKVGEPFAVSGFYSACSPAQSCPGNYYCHVGEAHNFCCPMLSGDPCGQPADRGMGRSQLARWYWEPTQQCCLPFSYCGLKGTQNNFLSKQDCERTCYELDNPCMEEPEMGPDGRPIQCVPSHNSQNITCSPDYWCHVGAGPSTTVCCPKRVPRPDVCILPLVVGSGESELARWYFDAATRRCVPFKYKGRYGNQNNFLSIEECERNCPAFVNVCPAGDPLLDQNGHPRLCTFAGPECGPGHWCHLGVLAEEFQCCPGAPTEPAACQGLPPVQGELGAPAPAQERWFFDANELVCKPFIYNGRKGNQNNFLSQQDCEATCAVFENPCPVPIPMPPQACSPVADTCAPAGWCHLGATPESTICCPNEGDVCTLPMSRGFGRAQLDRWFYNAQTGNCQPFTYTGLRGNANNFLTREACEERCGPNPCFEGRPFAGPDGRVQTCSASANINTCPPTYWCHIGGDIQTTVCCPAASLNICNLPMSTGEGAANLERFYFDQASRTCRPFIYNGLKGNQNNFASIRTCQLACQPFDNPCIGQPATTAAGQVLFCSVTNKDSCPVNFWCHIGATPETTVCCPGATNACSVPLAPGTGNAGLNRWYYNPDDRECVPFTYNGRRGNQNNFESQAECMRTCPEMLCLLSIDRGACGGRQTRYAFNRQTNTCVPFEYTGCGGNLNNFLSMADCMATCGNIGF